MESPRPAAGKADHMADKLEIQDFALDAKNGLTVFCREFRPREEPRGAVQIIHGIAEHKSRYDAFARFLGEAGWAVYTCDLPGHGPAEKLSGALGLFPEKDGWLKTAETQHALGREAKERNPGKPFFLLGHSMGSFLARTCLIRWPGEVTGCILSGTGHQAPALVKAGYAAASLTVKLRGREKPSETLRKLAFGSYNARIPDAASPNAWISRDGAVVEAYDADPLCGFVPTGGLIAAMLEGIARNQRKENLAAMPGDLPVLFIAGDRDPVGNMGKGVRQSEAAFRQAGLGDVSLKLYPGARHEVLNETDKARVWADVLAWLEARLG